MPDQPLEGTAAQPDDADLTSGLRSLSRLTSDLGLGVLMTRVAEYAVQAIPGAEGVGVTLTEPGQDDIIVKSADFVRKIDDIQYSLGEGPCISAAREGAVQRSGSLADDSRWPRFGPRISHLGVQSVLSLPLLTPDRALGAMNVYARAANAFDERAEYLGQLYAAPAAIAVNNARILAQTERLAAKLQAALTEQATVDQAIGILRSRTGLGSKEALAQLSRQITEQHPTLAAVAAMVIEAAVTRARSRRRLSSDTSTGE